MQDLPIIDLHQDISYYYVMGASGLGFPLEDFSKDVPGRHGDIPEFRRLNVKIVFSSIFCLLATLSPSTSKQLARGYGTGTYQRGYTTRATGSTVLEHMKVYYALEELHPAFITILRHAADIKRVMRRKMTGFLVALEGAYALEDTHDLKLFYNLGLRSLQLSWNFDNKYCASCMSKKDYGLTGDGEEVVDQCNKLGIIIDLAHASKKTHRDVGRVSKLPFVNSHSNAKAVHNVSRNLDDETYEIIKKGGGVVGAIFGSSMVGGKKSLDTLADHIMYVYDKFGSDILALGTDYFGIIDYGTTKGLENITKVGDLFNLLLKRGMGRKDLEKLAYKNSLRVITKNAERWV
ncbi:MAG: membrane dipeptidase [Thaumarchaeota archaeon]|nr:membrane dipeptidase [Nitrososphaerota archaeon]